MELFDHLKTIITKPQILRPYKRILLLSHMRANTSVFGHVLGSHEEIEGYYELHIGYYSWKSLIRQKLLYFKHHTPKPNAKYIFDKVLATEHAVNTNLFDNKQAKIIFMIREPQATIASIVKLYSKIEPNHAFATIEGASQYYIERLNQLAIMAKKLKHGYLSLNAEKLTEQPDNTLAIVSDFLELSTPLSKEYNILPKTGAKRAGDSSENIKSGVIISQKQKLLTLPHLSEELIEQYNKVVAILDENH
jgi:hypothetical protein